MTHHFQRDLDVVYQVILLPYKQRMSLLPDYEHNVRGDTVRSLEMKCSKTTKDTFL